MAKPVEKTTILNTHPFWMLLEMNTLWCFFESVAELCFTWPFAVLGKAKYQYRPLPASRKMVQVWECWRTPGRTLPKYHVYSPFDLELWPTTLTYSPSLAKVKGDPHAKIQGHRSNGSNRRAWKPKHPNKRTLPNVLSPGYALLRGR